MKTMMKRLGVLILVAVMMVMPINAEEASYGTQIDQIIDLIMNSYLYNDEVTEQDLYEAAMKGMFDSLDQFSSFMPATDASNFTNSLGNTYVGIGVQLIQEGDYVVITRVFSDGPAEGAGLKVHDKIIAVEGESILGFTPSEAANLIIGEEGTEVTITIDRSGYVFDVTMVRGTVTINAVDRLSISDVKEDVSQKLLDEVGYLKIGSFSNELDVEFGQVLEDLKAEGKTYLLLDLRDNGGGYVDAGVGVCDLLVPAGPVLRFVNNDGREIVYESTNTNPDFEIVALINENSASATEFVSAAIKESGVGTLVGENTYGKGVAQYLYNLEGGAMVRLTQEAFYSGEGTLIHGVGVAPDVIVEVPDYLTKEVKYHLGDWYDSVADVEKILAFLGYEVDTPDGVYDQKTFEAVRTFQGDEGLYAYGVCDFTTQDALNQALIRSMNENDIQLLKAIEILEERVANE